MARRAHPRNRRLELPAYSLGVEAYRPIAPSRRALLVPKCRENPQKRSSPGPRPATRRSEADMSGHSVARIPIRIFLVAALVAVAAMVPVRAARATGSQYYVATDGSDSNPGSLSKHWRTVERSE